MFPPPPVQGLGTTGGFKLQIEDRAGARLRGARRGDQGVPGQGLRRRRSWPACSPSYQVNVPQLYADIDRTKARQLGVPVTDVFDTHADLSRLLYVNDFNKFGRTYSVRVQADAPYRARAEDIGQLKVRSNTGEMVPLSALLKVKPSCGPGARDALQRLPRRRHQRRRRRPASRRPGAGRDRAHRRRDAAARASASSGPS